VPAGLLYRAVLTTLPYHCKSRKARRRCDPATGLVDVFRCCSNRKG
jgi:hypothetical protein